MTSPRIVGTLNSTWRFPVKSMGGESIDQVEVTPRGLVGDRAFALIEVDSGKVVSAKSVRNFPDVLNCRASFITPPQSGHDLPPVQIDFPDGTSVRSDSTDVDQRLSVWFQRKVTLAKAAPQDFTIDMYHPELEGETENTFAEQKLGSAYFAEAGLPSPVPSGAFFDLFPVSILTTSTLKRLGEIRPESNFDLRRFRMNVIVDCDASGFAENDWVGQRIAIGKTVELKIVVPDARCVMTTLAQYGLPRDPEILRTLARHNRIQVSSAGPLACAGVYALASTPGTVRSGDTVKLL
jgi:MOSC domain-containing protein